MKMRIKSCVELLSIIIIISLFCVLSLHFAQSKPVYMEFTNVSGWSTDSISIDNDNNYLEQTFEMPYEIFYGVSLKTDNLKTNLYYDYEMRITDVTNNKEILNTTFSTLDVKDDLYLDITLDNPIKVDILHTYKLEIKLISEEYVINPLILYISQSDDDSLFYAEEYQDAILTMNIFGGTTNNFWIIFIIFCNCIFVALGLYIYYLFKSKKTIKNNKIVLASILGIIIFLLLFAFKSIYEFCDEIDYIMSGLLIDKGQILYVDYFTQHMPFASYLCAFISFIFKAQSPEQFRVAYYLIIALVYALIYIRYCNTFGKVKMFLFPIIQIILSIFMYVEYARIIGDNIQSVCMIVLLLEFIQYLKDEKIDIKRSIIISLCIFCGITSIFTCVYQIFIIFVGFLIKEIMIWVREKNLNLRNLLNRYFVLLLMCLLPFLILILYLYLTNSICNMYEQAYLFNRQVYSKYMVYFNFENFGSNVFQPFYTGIINFIRLIPNLINNLLNKIDVFKSIIMLLMILYFFIINIINLKNKRYLLTFVLLMLVCISFARANYSFHTLPAWGIIFTIVIIYFDQIKILKKINYFILGTVLTIVFVNYLKMHYDYSKYSNRLISTEEYSVITATQENDYIFHDIYYNESLFYIYKNRFPINRMTFILPWYMEWYEDEAIYDLINNDPKVVLYDEFNEQNGVWGHYYYAPMFKRYLTQNYVKIQETPSVWVRKES